MNERKNGEIELLRFVFAMIIAILHFQQVYPLNVFSKGYIGVGFFFFITGVLLGKSAKKTKIDREQIPNYTYFFIKRKIASFYPYYIVALLFNLVICRVILQKNSIEILLNNLIKSIPRILLFDYTGVRVDNCIQLGTDWYLSAMILAIIVIYPILLYNYDWVSKLILPIIGLFGFGILYINYGGFSPNNEIMFSFLETNLVRGISGISLGVWAYEMSLLISKWKLTNLSKVLLTIFKWICFLSFIVYSYSNFSQKFQPGIFTLCLIGIMISFSENSYNIPNNSITNLLGKLSLPIYLIHIILRRICELMWGTNVEVRIIWLVICSCPVIAYVFMIFTDLFFLTIRKTKRIFIIE